MTLEEALAKVYGVAMTPLPAPPQMDLTKLMEYLKGLKAPEIPQLPTAPQFMQDYARQRGLLSAPPGALSE